jgi:hypothetical protein
MSSLVVAKYQLLTVVVPLLLCSWLTTGCECQLANDSHSYSYFMTVSLLPISLSCLLAPWGSQPEFFFLPPHLNPCGHSPYVTSFLTREWVCPLWICLAFCQVYVSHIQHVIENSPFCAIYKSLVSPGFAKQIMSVARILCYNGSLVTWTVVSLTTAKCKPLIFSVWLYLVLYCEHVHSHGMHLITQPVYILPCSNSAMKVNNGTNGIVYHDITAQTITETSPMFDCWNLTRHFRS